MNKFQIAVFLGLLAAASAQTLKFYAPTCSGTARVDQNFVIGTCYSGNDKCFGISGVGSCKIGTTGSCTAGAMQSITYYSDANCATSKTTDFITPKASPECKAFDNTNTYTVVCSGTAVNIKAYATTCAGNPSATVSGSGCSTACAGVIPGVASCKVTSCAGSSFSISGYSDAACGTSIGARTGPTGCSSSVPLALGYNGVAEMVCSSASTATASLGAVLLILVASLQLLN